MLFLVALNYCFKHLIICFYTACSQKDVVGVLMFNGSVCSFAYLNSKEPVSQAVADIKVFNIFQF